MNVSGADIPQVPYNRAMQNGHRPGLTDSNSNGYQPGQGQQYINNSLSNMHHIH